MVEFGGWDMPVEYSGITDEHLAVRSRAGLFDVSHMGEIEIAGADALAAVQWISCNDASRLAVGQAQYSALTTEQGTFVDDILVYRLADDHFLLVVNASNIAKDARWITDRVAERGGDAAVVNSSSRYALIALFVVTFSGCAGTRYLEKRDQPFNVLAGPLRLLARSGPVEAEGKHLGVGARLTRNWQGREILVTVEEQGFRWEDQVFPSLSAAATAIADSRWNGPRFFGLRDAA